MSETPDAFSTFEPWLHRELLGAGLRLREQGEVSETSEEILQQVVFSYLTSPYDSFRAACTPVLHAWEGTAVAERATRLILSLLRELEVLRDTIDSVPPPATPPASRSPLQERFGVYYRHLTQQSQSSLRLLRLQIILVLYQLGDRTTAVYWREYMLAALSDPVSDVRQVAAATLGEVGMVQPEVLDSLLHALSDSVSDVRLKAALVLGQLGVAQYEVINALLQAAIIHSYGSYAFFGTQTVAVAALKQLNPLPPEALTAFLHILTDSTEYFEREAAAIALGELGVAQPEILSALLHVLDDPGHVGRAAAKALGQLGIVQPEFLETLLYTLRTADGNVRNGVAMALGVLFAALDESAPNVRKAIVTVLRSLRVAQPELPDILLDALSDPDGALRRAAAMALGLLGTVQPVILEALLGALSDPLPGVRVRAIKALETLGMAQPDILGALLEALCDADGTVRLAAATALGSLSDAQPEVLDALLVALSDPVKEVHLAVIHTLTRLPVDRLAIGQRILEKLTSYDVIASNQFTADPVVDELFAALQQIVTASIRTSQA